MSRTTLSGIWLNASLAASGPRPSRLTSQRACRVWRAGGKQNEDFKLQAVARTHARPKRLPVFFFSSPHQLNTTRYLQLYALHGAVRSQPPTAPSLLATHT